MEGQVSWVVELAVKPGQLDAFKTLMEEMVAGTNAEPQTLNYEWYMSGDGDMSTSTRSTPTRRR